MSITCLDLNKLMMMAKPTAASAAAIIKTKKTQASPISFPHCLAKATKRRLAELSISSIARKKIKGLRLVKTPMTPIAKMRHAEINDHRSSHLPSYIVGRRRRPLKIAASQLQKEKRNRCRASRPAIRSYRSLEAMGLSGQFCPSNFFPK